MKWLMAAVLSTAVTVAPQVEQWRDLVELLFPADQVETALCVMHYESRGNPELINDAPTEAKGGSVGLYQIAADNWAGRNRVSGLDHWMYVTMSEARRWLQEPAVNIMAARAMWVAEGWLPAWQAQKRRCDLED